MIDAGLERWGLLLRSKYGFMIQITPRLSLWVFLWLNPPVPLPPIHILPSSLSLFSLFSSFSFSLILFFPLSLFLSFVWHNNTYTNTSFFPLDGIGWQDYGFSSDGKQHNFAFCMEIHSRFGFTGEETFSFTGDDDVFVYLDGRLMIDLGGVHSAKNASIDLSTIPDLVKGNSYRFDFFYCERHTKASSMSLLLLLFWL